MYLHTFDFSFLSAEWGWENGNLLIVICQV